MRLSSLLLVVLSVFLRSRGAGCCTHWQTSACNDIRNLGPLQLISANRAASSPGPGGGLGLRHDPKQKQGCLQCVPAAPGGRHALLGGVKLPVPNVHKREPQTR